MAVATAEGGMAVPLDVPEGLVYVANLENGIRRERVGDGFEYYAASGRRIINQKKLDRIASLAIPPAYEDVRISPDPNSHLQATGRDARGRKQYCYHPAWSEHRDETKFALLPAFAAALPRIREKVDADLRRRNLNQDRALAAVVWLLDNLFIRVGNETYAQANGSYGLTTLRNRHVKFEGSEIRFRFKGKSGKQWQLGYRDRRIANAIRKLQELPGQQLFQYLDEESLPHAVRSQDVNAYIRDASGDNFSSRQFRTWGATRLAATALSVIEPETSQRGITRQINFVIDSIANRLMNTRAVCRSSYIHPKVFEDFESGTLAGLGKIRLSSNANAALWMDDDERRVLKWLQS
ncbi:DNA topoisomerase IB [Rhizobium sp. LjRoot254]|uniref:DNA topoisomerase IB n=1 Tax=Rhizobium sp. LjRoot254 TaxID=3342297 RepID=UPI003ECCFF8F